MLLAQNPKPRIILGLMTYGPDETAGARITSLKDYNKHLDYFQQQGYNEVDTARVYVGGKQESFTAQTNWKERGLTLATKWYPHNPGDHKPEILKENFHKSLSELKAEQVDIFYLHAPDRSVPFVETLEVVDQLHKEGRFVSFGLSNFTAFEVAEVVVTSRSIEAELIPACRRYGLDIVIYNPLAGGIFSGKYKSSEKPDEGRYSDKVGKMGSLYRNRYFKDATFEALKVIEPVVKKHNLTLLETALRWCVHHSALKVTDGHDGILIGVSNFDQLQGNLKDLEKGPLPEEIVKALDEAWMICKSTTPNYWHLDLKYTYDTREALFAPK
ncbi:MAG: hypothetical protein M1812_007850 [Candelaria pacifica]|nr:MAG: hypothetical protein M1812_007850 [Candelaria pacifica]